MFILLFIPLIHKQFLVSTVFWKRPSWQWKSIWFHRFDNKRIKTHNALLEILTCMLRNQAPPLDVSLLFLILFFTQCKDGWPISGKTHVLQTTVIQCWLLMTTTFCWKTTKIKPLSADHVVYFNNIRMTVKGLQNLNCF